MQLSAQQRNSITILDENLDKCLHEVVSEINNLDHSVVCKVGSIGTEYLLTRRYISFKKAVAFSKEASLIVDIKKNSTEVIFEGDLCGEDGEILLDGPCLTLKIELINEENINEWMRSFEGFLKNPDIYSLIKLYLNGD